ncbi:MAG: ribonuclease Z [Flavobacteriaceae bacterium]|nr:MAG: ribonuclease Z [Flavobacteriaceae bacterium]
MIFNKEGATTVVSQENTSLKEFLKNLNNAYQTLKNDHIIVNLFSFSMLTTGDLLEFMELSNTHRGSNKSFVLVTSKVSYDEIPEEICVVPTIKEAKDIVEMEEIERDLGL